MPHGFKVDFVGWDVASNRAKLLKWADGFFGDVVWLNDKQLLGWSSEGHTTAGLRQLVHNNLTHWKCAKLIRHNRGWVSALSVNEFRALVGRVPKPVHVENVRTVTELLDEIVSNVTKIGTNRKGVRKRIHEEKLGCYAMIFKALRVNAVGLSKRAAEAAQHKISHLRAHLELLAQMRTEHPDVNFYLSNNWEKRTVQDEKDDFVQKVLSKPLKADKWLREYWEKQEADILQKLEKALVE
jgi:hypothetical protein